MDDHEKFIRSLWNIFLLFYISKIVNEVVDE